VVELFIDREFHEDFIKMVSLMNIKVVIQILPNNCKNNIRKFALSIIMICYLLSIFILYIQLKIVTITIEQYGLRIDSPWTVQGF